MKKNQPLPYVMVTPTTKEETHDRPITPEEIVSEGLMTQAEWDRVSDRALALFAFGQKEAASRGLILVDTKYEFGRDARTGEIFIIDEIHTPDSSRYWIKDSYEARLAAGKEPENIDKEFLRIWFRNHCDPYADAPLPDAPAELVAELSRRYIQLYETITGEAFPLPAAGTAPPTAAELAAAIASAVAPLFPPARFAATVFGPAAEDGPGAAAAGPSASAGGDELDAAANAPYAADFPVATRVAVESAALDIFGAPRQAADVCKAAAGATAGTIPRVAVVVGPAASCAATAEFVRRQSGLPTVAVLPGGGAGAGAEAVTKAAVVRDAAAAGAFVSALVKQLGAGAAAAGGK